MAGPGDTSDASGHRLGRAPIIVLGVLLLAVIAIWSTSLRGAFVFDDHPQIVEREQVLAGPWSAMVVGERRPVVTLSLGLNHAISALQPWSYHVLNVVLHLLAGIVLFDLIRRSLAIHRGTTQTRDAWIAGVVAGIWLVHPVQTASVTYTIQRAEILSGLACLVVLSSILRLATSERRVGWTLVAIAACAIGMGAKATMVVAPVMAYLFDAVVISRSFTRPLRERWGVYLALAACWMLLIPTGVAGALIAAPDDGRAAVGFEVASRPALTYLITQPVVILHYLRLAVWPSPLCIDYGWAPMQLSKTWPAVVIVGLLILGVVIGLVRSSALAFIGAAFFLWLAPSSSVVPIRDLAAEHRMYLPLAIVVLLMVLAVAAGLGALRERRTSTLLAVGLSVIVLSALAWRTVVRNGEYADPVKLWQATIEVAPGHARAHTNLGIALHDAGETAEAVAVLEAAVSMAPNYAPARYNLGCIMLDAGRFEEACRHLGASVSGMRNRFAARLQYADALRRAGRLDEAIVTYARAVELEPDRAALRLVLGNTLLDADRASEATDELRRAAELAGVNEAPVAAAAWFNLGNLHYREARWQDAVDAYDAALEAWREHPEAERWRDDARRHLDP